VTAQGSDGAVDFAYLEGFLGGDAAVMAEVLGLFRQQAELWGVSLAAPSAEWRDLVHTIKGAARGVGANALGETCARAEAEGAACLPAVRAALQAAVAEIVAYQDHA
jgi:HPt (histidine-containing phosphotransfer) domain-containing protein